MISANILKINRGEGNMTNHQLLSENPDYRAFVSTVGPKLWLGDEGGEFRARLAESRLREAIKSSGLSGNFPSGYIFNKNRTTSLDHPLYSMGSSPQDKGGYLPPESVLGAEGAKFRRAIEEAKLRRAVADYEALRQLDEEAERIWLENEKFKKSLRIIPMDSNLPHLIIKHEISPLERYMTQQLNKHTIEPTIPLPLENLLPPKNEDSLPFPQKTRKPTDLGDFSF